MIVRLLVPILVVMAFLAALLIPTVTISVVMYALDGSLAWFNVVIPTSEVIPTYLWRGFTAVMAVLVTLISIQTLYWMLTISSRREAQNARPIPDES